MIKERLKRILNILGYDVRRFPNGFSRKRIDLLKSHGIEVLLDVGANRGNYGWMVRNTGYENQIISFEPLLAEFNELKRISEKDNNWIVKNFALGNMDGKILFNIAGNSYSSSILEMNESHKLAAPHSVYVGHQEAEIKKLDSIFGELTGNKEKKIFLKLDVQGYENQVLYGAEKTISEISGIELEMSLIELYKGERLMTEMIKYLDSCGFDLMTVEPEFTDPISSRLLQVNGIFFRNEI